MSHLDPNVPYPCMILGTLGIMNAIAGPRRVPFFLLMSGIHFVKHIFSVYSFSNVKTDCKVEPMHQIEATFCNSFLFMSALIPVYILMVFALYSSLMVNVFV